MKPAGPPRALEALLAATLPEGIVREDVVGSLAEEFALRAGREGRAAARRWYVRQASGVAARALLGRAAEAGRRFGRGWTMGSLIADGRFTRRAARRAPGPYVVILITIALGVGVNAAMFSVVNGVILSPVPYPQSERLVGVWPEKRWSVEMFRDVRERTLSFDAMGVGLGGSLTLLGDGEPEVLGVRSVTSGWFETLGVRPHLGRLLRPEDEVATDGATAILSHGLWVRRFGSDRGVVGRTVDLSGYGVERRTIVGVLPTDHRPYAGGSDVWIPWITDPETPGYRGTYGGVAVARLAPGVGAGQAIADMRRTIPELRSRHPTQFRESRESPVDVVPISELLVRDVRTQLYVLLGAVALVLLIACSNVANLLLARASARRREVGLRLAMGADRARVLRQMVTESVLLGAVGGAVGLGAVAVALPVLRSQVEPYLPRTDVIELDASVVLFAVGISLAAGLLFGAVPAVRGAREDPATVLGHHTRGSGQGVHGRRVNDALVTTEVALSLVLVVGAAILLKSLWTLADVDPGFQSEGVLTFNVVVPAGAYDEGGARRALFADLLNRVRAVPGVGDAAMVNYTPLIGSWAGIPYQVGGQDVPEGESIVAGFRVVSPAYHEVLGIPLVEGRLLSDEDVDEGETVAVVNESFVRRHWPGESGLGQVILTTGGDPIGRVVGVVADTRSTGLDDEPMPSIYFAADQMSCRVSDLLVRTDVLDALTLVEPVTAAIHEAEPTLPVRRPRLLAEMVAGALGDARLYARLLGGFAGIALTLGLIGVYGVMSYAVSQRTREIEVRLALGAGAGTVLRETLASGMVPVFVGTGLGLAGAYAASRFLAGLVYEVTVTDPWVFAGVAVLLVVTGSLATLMPAVRAMRLDPVTALRREG